MHPASVWGITTKDIKAKERHAIVASFIIFAGIVLKSLTATWKIVLMFLSCWAQKKYDDNFARRSPFYRSLRYYQKEIKLLLIKTHLLFIAILSSNIITHTKNSTIS